MTAIGQRKAALYLASLAPDEQRALIAALPAATARTIKPLVAQVIANGWHDAELVGRALAEEIRGLTAQTSLSVDALLALAKVLPPDWTARLFAANAALDSRFMLALLDAPLAKRVQEQLSRVQRLPERLKDALLAEAQASVREAE
jgi:hypothetical protein